MKFCIIGLGRFGYHVAINLADAGMEVLAVDRNESLVVAIRDHVTQAVCMEITNKESLEAIGIDEIETVIVSMGENFAQSVLITALLKKELGTPTVIARATSKLHADILSLVGADNVELPEREQAIALANRLSTPCNITMLSKRSSIAKITAPESFIGKTVQNLDLKKKFRVMCVGVQKGDVIIPIDPTYTILEGDQLVFLGENDYLEALARL